MKWAVLLRLLLYPEREQVYLETDKPMKPGKTFSVRLKFEYSLSQSLEGFYLSTYKDKQGNERLPVNIWFHLSASFYQETCNNSLWANIREKSFSLFWRAAAESRVHGDDNSWQGSDSFLQHAGGGTLWSERKAKYGRKYYLLFPDIQDDVFKSIHPCRQAKEA